MYFFAESERHIKRGWCMRILINKLVSDSHLQLQTLYSSRENSLSLWCPILILYTFTYGRMLHAYIHRKCVKRSLSKGKSFFFGCRTFALSAFVHAKWHSMEIFIHSMERILIQQAMSVLVILHANKINITIKIVYWWF
jgi:hypothetical protein